MASEPSAAPEPTIPPNSLGLPLRVVWRYVGLALLALVVFNALLYVFFFIVPYTNLAGLELPYAEDFEGKTTSDVIPLRGVWEVLDNFLIQHNPTGADLGAVIPLNIPADQPYTFQADLTRIDGQMGGGLLFNMQTRNRQQRAHVVRFTPTESGGVAVMYGFFGADGMYVGQGATDALGLPADDTARHTLAVQVGEGSYVVLLDGEPVTAAIPLVFSGGRIGLLTAQSKVVFDNLRAFGAAVAADAAAAAAAAAATDVALQPTAAPVEAAAPAAEAPAIAGDLLFAENFADVEASRAQWIPIAGEWAFEPGALVQTTADGYDFAAGYAQPFSAYRLRVMLEHRQGLGGGLLFNMPAPESRSGAHLVRYIDNVLVWGYFTPEGAFTGQGSAPVPNPGTTSHALEVVPGAETYAIWLDGAPVAADIPLVSSGAYIGLTNSQSVVAFTGVEVYGTAAAAPALNELDSINGEWVTEGGVTTQRLDAATDFVAGTGVIGETYRVSVAVTLPDDPELADAGGGLLIHMNGRDDPALGVLVRFGSGGKSVMWGTYDEQRVFYGQGGAPLELAAGTPQRLTLDVRQGSFDILVNDAVIATDIPLSRESGWIGLVSFRGPVAFSDFQLTFGG